MRTYMWPTHLHLILSALFPIYAGAHASLSRPSSAAKRKHSTGEAALSEDEAEEVYQRMEGLGPSDAILFPLMAGGTLASLYFLIKWLEDPAILNKVLGLYFSVFGIFAIGKFVSDVLNVAHSFAFPKWYHDKGVIWFVDGETKEARPAVKPGATSIPPGISVRTSPLPGRFGRIPLPTRVCKVLWLSRQLLVRKITMKFYIYRLIACRRDINAYGLIAFVSGLAAAIYSNLVGSPWWLTNLSGFAFAYTALQLMTPTTFGTGSLILAALFCYDVYMVFFTPMMATVALALEIPIKLEFPRASTDRSRKSGNAILGLGDVVIPGLMIGLGLRFDLYLHYLRKQKRISTSPHRPEVNVSSPMEKVVYVPPARHWSTHFWTTPWFSPSAVDLHGLQTGAFPKVYFHASLTGYVIGMLSTVAAMEYSKHPQPALLYLVPWVLGSLWFTAIIRGDLNLMYNFSEAFEDETEDQTQTNQKREQEKAEPRCSANWWACFPFPSDRRNTGEPGKASSGLAAQGSSESVRDLPSPTTPSETDGKSPIRIPEEETLEDGLHRATGRDWFYLAISSPATGKTRGAADVTREQKPQVRKHS